MIGYDLDGAGIIFAIILAAILITAESALEGYVEYKIWLEALKKLNGNKINSISKKNWRNFVENYERVASLISSYWG